MNLFTKNLFNNFCFKHVSINRFIYKEIRFTRAQYYTCINMSSKSEVFKPKSLKVCKVFTLSSVKNYWPTLNSKFKEILRHTFLTHKQKYLGYLWYQSLEVLNMKEFFTLLEMPDTFFSRFRVIELHVWMLLYHLPQESRPQMLIRYGLIEAMWCDTEKRAIITEKYNLNFRKNMKALYGKFKLSLLLYDEGFYGDDMALTNALWHSFFGKSNVDPRILEALVSYVRHQMNKLNELNIEMLTEKPEKGVIWLPLEPHVKKIFDRP